MFVCMVQVAVKLYGVYFIVLIFIIIFIFIRIHANTLEHIKSHHWVHTEPRVQPPIGYIPNKKLISKHKVHSRTG